MGLEELLNKTREKYQDWFIDMENEQVYYLLAAPYLSLTEGMDAFEIAWDEAVNHIAVTAYLPGQFITDQSFLPYKVYEYKIIVHVLYLKLEVKDNEIERLKLKDPEDLKWLLNYRKVLESEEVCYYPEVFEKMYLSDSGKK